jgi:hypothetical protein
VVAVLTRRANYQPALDLDQRTPVQPELDDDRADRSPVAPIGDTVDPIHPQAALRRLRGWVHQ